jgi:alpha-mannosidase
MPESQEEQRPRLLVVATVHLDSQWRWTIQDTIRDFIPKTLRENFVLFESHPNYQLSFEGAFRYMLAREYYPEEFEEMKRWVAAGRWHPVGGMLDAPDVNIASPESLMRHILYGNGFFREELGRASRDIFLVDCFGFGRALPSLAAHCGLESMSSSKLIKWIAPGEIPFDIGRWRGPDGAEIVAALRPGGYGEPIEENLAESAEWEARIGRLAEITGNGIGMRYVGIGDRGGSVPVESLDQLEAGVNSNGRVEVECGSPDSLAGRFSTEQRAALPVHDDELLLPTHGTGCWTSQALLKRWNRANEQLAAAAEAAAVVADWLDAMDYPLERLNEGWLRFLWHQMHDDLTGTSIPAAYRFTWNDEAVAANLFAGVLTDAVAAIAPALDTSSDGTPLVVYNSLGQEREEVVEARLQPGEIPPGPLAVRGPDGELVPSQIAAGPDGDITLLFLAQLAPVSFSVFEIVPAEESAPEDHASPHAEDHLIENHRYRIELNAQGDPASVFDKQLERELLAEPIRLELLRNHSMRWPAWEIRPETVLDPAGLERVEGPAEVRVIESGPVRAAIEVRRRSHGFSPSPSPIPKPSTTSDWAWPVAATTARNAMRFRRNNGRA